MGFIFAIANQKGGVGKTTLALNLAGAFCFEDPDLRVLLIDADSQNTSVRSSGLDEKLPLPFTVVSLAAAGKALGRSIKDMSKNYDIVLVDCPPSLDTPHTQIAIESAHYTLVPLDASPADAWSTTGVLQLVRRTIPNADSTRCGIVFNKAKPNTNSFKSTKAAFEDMGDFPVLDASIATRDIYKVAMGLGKTVFDVKGQRAAKEARAEIAAVAREMLSLMQGAKAQKEAEENMENDANVV